MSDPDPVAADSAMTSELSGTILLVDDNEQNLELMLAYLDELGCRVVTARDGVEALERFAECRPDLVLLDIMMPRMSGFQVCAKLKEDPATSGVPIVMVTALNETSDVERAVESGADDFLTKPVNKLELLTRARSLLHVRQLRSKLDETVAELKRARGDTD